MMYSTVGIVIVVPYHNNIIIIATEVENNK